MRTRFGATTARFRRTPATSASATTAGAIAGPAALVRNRGVDGRPVLAGPGGVEQAGVDRAGAHNGRPDACAIAARTLTLSLTSRLMSAPARSAPTTVAPSARSRSVMPAPIPRAAPVT